MFSISNHSHSIPYSVMTLLICVLSYADIKCGPKEASSDANMELSMCVQLKLRGEE